MLSIPPVSAAYQAPAVVEARRLADHPHARDEQTPQRHGHAATSGSSDSPERREDGSLAPATVGTLVDVRA